MPRRPQPLYRTDIRQKKDTATNSVFLRYAGRKLRFHGDVYGFPEGTFFVANLDEVEWPPDLEALADELCIDLESLPDARRMREVIVELMVATAMVEAPELLFDLARPKVRWQDWDLRLLERKHVIAAARLLELERLMASDVRLRAEHCPQPELERTLAPLPPSAGYEAGWAPPVRDADPQVRLTPPVAETAVVREVSRPGEGFGKTEDVESRSEDVEIIEGPASQTVKKALAAIRAAREAELPQRLPGGARRRLRSFPPAAYIAYGEAIDPRPDLCGAMTDGRAMGRKGREVAIIDWDGEWPVVVRRYGQGGRTIYKVEDALRRAGVEVSDAA